MKVFSGKYLVIGIFIGLLIGSLMATIFGVAIYFQYTKYKDLLRPKYYISGILKYQPEPDPALSVAEPGGYYIESIDFGRIYIKNESISGYLERSITIRGWLNNLCGPDLYHCYPLIEAKSVEEQIKDSVSKFGNDSEIGKNCSSDSECRLPISYARLSHCLYKSRCINNQCKVICSSAIECEKNLDCNCSFYLPSNISECSCFQGKCTVIAAQ